jgi:signal peptidase I
MNPGDIVVLKDNQLYNITTGVDYNNIPDTSKIKECLETITDDYSHSITDFDRFNNILKSMSNLYSKKNHDYGNSFELSLNEEGLAASRIRIGDKWRRYKTLSRGIQNQVSDESIRDTLLDMANYSIMTIIWLDKHNN